ncbi:MAG: acetyl-CoA carboxylase biotin carboxyl carrier protein [Thermomicrobiaceae bacterium]
MAEDREVQDGRIAETDSTGDYSGLTEAVRDLVQVMNNGDLERLEVTHGDLHILLCARTTTNAPVEASSPAVLEQNGAVPPPSPAQAPSGHQITSPMVGTFYEGPSPGEPPFVRVGDTVEVGQTVAIIEAMKIMNEIVADRPGVIEAMLVENGETVEYGHPLFRLRTE